MIGRLGSPYMECYDNFICLLNLFIHIKVCFDLCGKHKVVNRISKLQSNALCMDFLHL